MSHILQVSESSHGFQQPGKLKRQMFSESGSTEGESNAIFSVPELTCRNYRKLPWDMPVDTPESTDPSRAYEHFTNQVTKPARRSLPLRNDDHFRSIYAIHFCHNPDFVRDYNVRGVRDRDMRRRRLLGDVYYCINHPPHYRLMEARLRHEYEMMEEAKADARKVDMGYIDKYNQSDIDPVLLLPPVPSLGEGEFIAQGRVKITKPQHPSNIFTVDDTTDQSMENVSPVQTIHKLYRQAKAILEHIHLPPDIPTPGILRTLYKNNDLTTFEAYENLSETSNSRSSTEIGDPLIKQITPINSKTTR